MVMLYVGGKPAGTLADAGPLLAEPARDGRTAEFRDEAGVPLGTFTLRLPAEPLVPWDASIDEAEIQRRLAGEFVSFAEFERRLGLK